VRIAADDVVDLAVEQHRAFCATVDGFGPGDWDRPSLCDGWTARDVVIHVAGHVHHTQGFRQRLGDLTRSRFSASRAAERDVARHRHLDPEAIRNWLASPLDLLADGRFDACVQLGELVIHHHDITSSVGDGPQPSPEVLSVVLDFGLTPKGSLATAGGRRRGRGLHLVADDIDWSAGRGPDVSGPAASLLMALSGRAVALQDLEGDGVDRLRVACRAG
jgi:uncharacterized protein (TIGR03083 family)